MGVFGEKHTSLTREQKRQLIHQADTHKLRPTEVCDWVLQTWGLRIARVTVYSILHKQRASLMAGHKDLYQSMQKTLSAAASSSSSTATPTPSTPDQPASSDAHLKRCRKGSTSRIAKRTSSSPSSSHNSSHRRNSSASSVYMSCSPSPAPADLTFASTTDSSHALSHSPCGCNDASRCSHANYQVTGSAGSAQPNSSSAGILGSLGSSAATSSRSASGAKWEGQLKRVREPASVELDRAMVRFLKSEQAVDVNGRRLNDAELQSHALRLAKSIPSAARMRCSFGWLRHFKRRLGVQWAADRLGRYRWIIEMDHEEDNHSRNCEPSTDALSSPRSEASPSPFSTQASSPTPSLAGSPSAPFPTAFEDSSLTHADNTTTPRSSKTKIAASPSRKRKSGTISKASQSSSAVSTPSVSSVDGSWPILTNLKQEADQDHDALHHHQLLYQPDYSSQPLGSVAAALHGPSRQQAHAAAQGFDSHQLFASTTGSLSPLDTLPPLVMPNNTHGSPSDISTAGADSHPSTVKHESNSTQTSSTSSTTSTSCSSTATNHTSSFGMGVDGGMRKVPTKEEALEMLQSLLLYYEQDHHYIGEQQTLLLPRWIHQQRQIMQQITTSNDSRLSWLRAAPPTSLFNPIDFSLGAAGSGPASAPTTPAAASTASSSLGFLGLSSPAPPSTGHHHAAFQLQQPPHMPMGMHPLALPLHHQSTPTQGTTHGLHPLTPLSPLTPTASTTPSAAAAAAAAATTASLLSAAASAGLLTTTTSSTSSTPTLVGGSAVGSAGTTTVSTSTTTSIPSLASPIEQQMYYAHQQHVAETQQLARMMYSSH